MVIKTAGGKSDLLILTSEQKKRAEQLAEKFDIAGLVYGITALEKLRWSLKNSDTARPLLEAALLRLAMSEHFLNVDQLLGQSRSFQDKKKVTEEYKATEIAQPTQQHEKLSQIGGSDLDSIKSNWRTILEAVGKGTAGLLAVAQPTSFDNGTLKIEFPASAGYQKKTCEDRVSQIESALKEHLGTPVKVKVQFSEGKQESADKPAQAETRSSKYNALMNDPAVKTILMGLDATITNIEDQ
jgi:DNA polymerase III gamma/tau subunit